MRFDVGTPAYFIGLPFLKRAVFIGCLLKASAVTATTRVWIDCDPGQDDATAILLAAQLPGVDVVGYSSVFGNKSSPLAAQNIWRTIRLQSIATAHVIEGSDNPLLFPNDYASDFHGKDGLGDAGIAPYDNNLAILRADPIKNIYQKLRLAKSSMNSKSDRLVLVATGALTNVARLLLDYPDTTLALDEIIIMGGAIGKGNYNGGHAEFNIWRDPEAAQIVFNHPVEKIIVPLDVTNEQGITTGDIDDFAKQKGKHVPMFTTFLRNLLQKYVSKGSNKVVLHDAIAISFLHYRERFSLAKANVRVIGKDSQERGKTYVSLNPSAEWKQQIRIATAASNGFFWPIMRSVLLSVGMEDKR